MKKTLLLIGGNGLIGRHIQEVFKDEEEWTVKVIDKEDVDLSTDRSIVETKKIIKYTKPNAIILLAAIKRQNGDERKIKDMNNKITENLCYALEEYNQHIIYFSSCAVYGEKNEQKEVVEETRTYPTSEYGHHKLYSENCYKDKLDKSAKLLIVRPPLVYSIYEMEGYSPGGFLNSALKTGIINLWGDGTELREFIDVKDVAKITKKFIQNESTGVINLVSGISYSYQEIADYIGKKINITVKSRERTNRKVDHTYKNIRIDEEIGQFEYTNPFNAISTVVNKRKVGKCQ